MLQKVHGLQILMTAVDIGHPLAIILAVIQIQHGRHRIHTDTVCVVLLCPEQCICDQEVCNLRPSVIIDQGTPVRMRSLPRILMLVNTASVEACQTVGITRKMSRYPVQDHADALFMHVIHEIHKIIRRAIPACRRIVAGYLIAPGFI